MNVKRITDPLKLTARAAIVARGYSTAEAAYGIGFFRDGLKVTTGLTTMLTNRAIALIKIRLDELKIGTEFYQGFGYFWSYSYRFWMRGDAHHQGDRLGISIQRARREVHQGFLDAGLELDGESPEHAAIINSVFKCDAYN